MAESTIEMQPRTMFVQDYDNDEDYTDEEDEDVEDAQFNLPCRNFVEEEGFAAPPENDLRGFLDRLDEEHNSEDEGIEDYKLGGYHPVHIGQVLAQRYVIIQKLGWGHFSTVWLAKDFKYNNYVAVKIMKSAPHYIEAAYDEVEILQKVASKASDPEWVRSVREYEPRRHAHSRDDTHVVHMLNSFLFKGPYGNHFCMVFQILGVNLLEILKRYNYQGVPMDICKQISRQVLIGLDFLHRICKVIHTDLKPQNVLVCLTEQEIKQIVEKGQLTKNELFSERIQIYQQFMGIVSDDPKRQELDPEVRARHTASIQEAKQKLEAFDQKLEKLKGVQRKNMKKKRKKIQEALEEAEAELKKAEQLMQQSKKKKSLDELLSGEGKVRFDRGPKLQVGKFSVKIADLGNACWTHHHFATEIQTRQYRSPEVLLGSMYDTSSDLWSMACMTYEMLTSDLLFNPRKDQEGESFGKNDDHIAQMMELLGRFPKKFSLRGVKAKKYMNKNGSLRRINRFTHWSLKDVIVGKFKLKEDVASRFAKFLLPMLEPIPEQRATARDMLFHPWLKEQEPAQIKMTEEEYKVIYEKIKNNEPEPETTWFDSDNEQADCEDAMLEDGEDLEFYGYERRGELRLIDRSFTDLGYIGYGDGIKLEELDTVANWQFS